MIIRHMKNAFLPRFLTWGIKVERMELLDICPRNSKCLNDMNNLLSNC